MTTGLWSSWEGHGLGSGSMWFIKQQKPCPEQNTPAAATMKGALPVLALLVTRQLTFETHEGRKEALDDHPDPCPVLSHCILPSPVQAALRGRFIGQVADQFSGAL